MQSRGKQIAQQIAVVGWRLIVYFALLIGGFMLLSLGYKTLTHALGVHFAQALGVRPAEAVGFGQARLLIAAIAAWLITARLGRDQLQPILPIHGRGARHLLEGTVWGFAGVAATIGAIAFLGGYRVNGVAVTGADIAYYVPLWLVIALINGVAENLAIMGYPMFRTAKASGWPFAVILVSLLFAAAHLGNPGENPIGIVSVFLIGTLMATTVWLTGDLWLSAGIHAGIIIGEDLVFSVPDSGATYTGHLLASHLSGPAWLSGGDAGPEGSAFALPVFALIMVVLWRVYRRKSPDSSSISRDDGPLPTPQVAP